MIILRPEDPWPQEMRKNPAAGVPEYQDVSLTDMIIPIWNVIIGEQRRDESGDLYLLLGPRAQGSWERLVAERCIYAAEPYKSQGRKFLGMTVLFTAMDAIEIVRDNC